MAKKLKLMFMNMKGGVGKTSLAIHTAYAIAYYTDKKVLLIDYDPQANASYALLSSKIYFDLKGKNKTLSGVLTPKLKTDDPFHVLKVSMEKSKINIDEFAYNLRNWEYSGGKPAGSLDIIAGDIDLMRVALNELEKETEELLLNRWNDLMSAALGKFDCIIIDCHPAGSFFTKSAILSSDAVIIPVTTDGYAATGLQLMHNFLDSWGDKGGAKQSAVIFNDVNNNWDRDVETSIRSNPKFSSHCMANSIRYSKLFRNVPSLKKLAFEQERPYYKYVSANLKITITELIDYLFTELDLDESWIIP